MKTVRTFSRKKVHVFAFTPTPASALSRVALLHLADVECEGSLQERLEQEASDTGRSLADFVKEVTVHTVDVILDAQPRSSI